METTVPVPVAYAKTAWPVCKKIPCRSLCACTRVCLCVCALLASICLLLSPKRFLPFSSR